MLLDLLGYWGLLGLWVTMDHQELLETKDKLETLDHKDLKVHLVSQGSLVLKVCRVTRGQVVPPELPDNKDPLDNQASLGAKDNLDHKVRRGKMVILGHREIQDHLVHLVIKGQLGQLVH